VSAALAGAPCGGWRPLRVLGASSAMSLALPAAQPTPSQLYAPRGVLLDAGPDATRLIAADTGNHRLMVWNDLPAADELPHVPPGPARLRFPYATVAVGDHRVVADTANNRVLVWRSPSAGAAAAEAVLGQQDLDAAGENRWSAVTADSLCWPYGLSAATDPRHGDVLAVADSGNNRVVLWSRP